MLNVGHTDLPTPALQQRHTEFFALLALPPIDIGQTRRTLSAQATADIAITLPGHPLPTGLLQCIPLLLLWSSRWNDQGFGRR